MSFSAAPPEYDPASKHIMQTAVHPPKDFVEASSKVRAFNAAPICLLDDDLSMLKALDRLLKSDGFNVETFSDPAIFLSSMGRASCRVAILDVWMPDMNGLEVQSVLRKEAPDTRIIFISGRDDPSVRQTALEAGAFGFLSKPFDDEVLLQLVRKALAA
jgi:two-component system response regulator HydG